MSSIDIVKCMAVATQFQFDDDDSDDVEIWQFIDLQLTEENSAKQKVCDVDVSLSSLRRGKDETRLRPRVKCKPPRSMYLSRDDLASAVTAPSGIVHGETLVKMTESQLLVLRRQAS